MVFVKTKQEKRGNIRIRRTDRLFLREAAPLTPLHTKPDPSQPVDSCFFAKTLKKALQCDILIPKNPIKEEKIPC